MKISTVKFFRFLVLLLLLTIFPSSQVLATQSGCHQAADSWISQLHDKDNTELFLRYTEENCNFSGDWVKRSEDVASKPQRERMCQDLVLLWSYKNCIYFRDVINPEAYEPCKAWSREMHQHCMDNDVNWFP